MQSTGQIDLLLEVQLRTCYAFLFRFVAEICQARRRTSHNALGSAAGDASFGEFSSYKLQCRHKTQGNHACPADRESPL